VSQQERRIRAIIATRSEFERTRMLIIRRKIAGLTTALALSAAPTFADGTRPSFRIVRSWPLTVHATGFHASERVTVSVHMGRGHWSRRTSTDTAGAFSTRFAELRLRYCSLPLTITARGANGEFVHAPIPRRECAPNATDG
jgi:hypothetical protein